MSEKRSRTLTEKLWARNKYTVMAKGYEHYKRVSVALKNADSTEELFAVYKQIEETLNLPYTKKGMRTTLQHMWGYFKKEATSEEKDVFFVKLEYLMSCSPPLTDQEVEPIRDHLMTLLGKYPSQYLLNSTLIQPHLLWNEVDYKKQKHVISRNDYFRPNS